VTESIQLCTFFVGDLHCGLAVQHVQEILRHQELTPVPLAPRGVTGLLNLRGEVVTGIDLRYVLDFDQRRENDEPSNVIIRTSEGVVSLLVDTIGDVLDVPASTFEPPPRTLSARARSQVRGVFKLPLGLLLELDIDRITEIGSAQEARPN